MSWEEERHRNVVYSEHRERCVYWSEQYQELYELSVESMGDAKQKQLEAEARVIELEVALLPFVAPLKGPVVRCEITLNPCGTDTWAVGRPCKCKACQAYLKAKEILEGPDPSSP
jgi:hypothetical protein